MQFLPALIRVSPRRWRHRLRHRLRHDGGSSSRSHRDLLYCPKYGEGHRENYDGSLSAYRETHTAAVPSHKQQTLPAGNRHQMRHYAPQAVPRPPQNRGNTALSSLRHAPTPRETPPPYRCPPHSAHALVGRTTRSSSATGKSTNRKSPLPDPLSQSLFPPSKPTSGCHWRSQNRWLQSLSQCNYFISGDVPKG